MRTCCYPVLVTGSPTTMNKKYFRDGSPTSLRLAMMGAVASITFAVSVCAQTPGVAETTSSDTPAPANAAASIDVDTFTGPKLKKHYPPTFPLSERMARRDGWVMLYFMIDPQGKAHDIVVSDSTGNKTFERAAIEAVKEWEFEPAMLAGQRVEAAYDIKIIFNLDQDGAKLSFVTAYRDFQLAAQAKDRAAMEAQIARMKVENLYEDAFFHLARYQYAQQWGSEREQLQALTRALAEEQSPVYLPKQAFISALFSRLRLEIKTNELSRALNTWKT